MSDLINFYTDINSTFQTLQVVKVYRKKTYKKLKSLCKKKIKKVKKKTIISVAQVGVAEPSFCTVSECKKHRFIMLQDGRLMSE